MPTGFYYLATPYSRLPDLEYAALKAAECAGFFMAAGVSVFSPIVHGHKIATICQFDHLDQDFWREMNEPFVKAARGLVVVELDGWKESEGIKEEVTHFNSIGKPIVTWKPGQPIPLEHMP